jgi:hypothetical protein
MSQSTSGPTIGTPAPPGTAIHAALTDKAIAAAKDVPSLLAGLQAINSPLADQITGKSLVASKTPIVTLLVTAAAWASTKWGLGWSDAVDEAVAGFALLVASYVMRYVSTLPITGLFQKQSAPTATTIGTKT